MKDRWVMNKIGLNGYWWFNDLEIQLSENGNVLINGKNATGKTNTLAAIITPLLDGDTSAVRMDAFGAQGKKLRHYVLGVGDSAKESGTCYIFAEFINRCTGEMKTLVMGVYDHKTKDSPQKHFWIITDGTRMKIDVPVLIEHKVDGNDVYSPVMISQMKSTLANSAEYFTKADDYAKAVNRHLYGFAAHEEFKKMIEALLLIRKSKLNENNNHTAILSNLSDSLPTIDEEVVYEIAKYGRSIEELEFRLKNNRDDFGEIKRIRNAYEILQKSVLAEKAKLYRSENANLNKIEKSFLELFKNKEELLKELTAKNKELDILKKTYDDAMNFLNLDGIKGLRDLPAQRVELENRKAAVGRRISQDNQTVNSQETQMKTLEESIDDFSYKAGEKKTLIIKKAKAVIESAERIDIGTFDIHDLPNNPEVEFNEKMALADAGSELSKFKKTKDIVDEAEKKKSRAEDKENEYESKLAELKSSMKVKDEASNKVLYLVGELVADIHKWEKTNAVFIIEKEEDKKKLIQAANSMDDSGAGVTLSSALNDAYLGIYNGKTKSKSEFKDKIDKSGERISTIEKQIEDIRAHGEVLVKRPISILEHRKSIKAAKIDYVELYKAFKFKENAPTNMMKNIEYALSVSGIIDTIMVPEDYRNEFMNTHEDESDLFMMIDGSADITETRSLCKYLVPEEGAVGLSLISQAERFLRSIGDSKDFKNYIGTDGTFRLGQISGVTDKNYEPVMIGETTRIEHMAKMIAGLEFEISDEKSAVEECLVKINEIERELAILEKEKDGFPDTEDLEIEKSRLENAERKIGQLSEESQRAKSEFDSLTFEAKALISQAKSLLNNRQIDYTSGGIASAIDIIYEVTFGIKELSNEQRAMLGMLKSCERASFDLIDKKILIGGIRDNIYEGRKDLSDIESQLEAIIEILDSSEDKEKLEKIKICEGIVKSYSGNNDAIHDNITSISTEIATIQVTIDEKNQSKAVALEKKNVLREMLERMMELYKVKESFDEVSVMADAFIKKNDMKEFEGSYQLSKERLYGDFRFEISNESFYDYTGENEDIIFMTSSAKILLCKGCFPGQVVKKNLSPKELYDEINANIVSMEDAISKKSDAMFREISNSRATIVIFEKYRQAKSYIDELKRDISSREMAGGLKLFLEWEKNETFTGGEVKVNNLIKFMTDASKENEFKESIKRFIQYKIDQEKISAKEEIRDVNFEKAVFDALDYRKWFEFKIFYEKDGESKTELTPANYNVLSGGMKSTISYAPLISSLTLLMNKAQPTAPRIVALDEAFAGVDLEGADMMFEYIESLDFSYVMTSEKLTGLYPAISNISIVTYDKDVKTKEISTLKYYWSKGKHHVFPDSIENIISQEAGGNN